MEFSQQTGLGQSQLNAMKSTMTSLHYISDSTSDRLVGSYSSSPLSDIDACFSPLSRSILEENGITPTVLSREQSISKQDFYQVNQGNENYCYVPHTRVNFFDKLVVPVVQPFDPPSPRYEDEAITNYAYDYYQEPASYSDSEVSVSTASCSSDSETDSAHSSFSSSSNNSLSVDELHPPLSPTYSTISTELDIDEAVAKVASPRSKPRKQKTALAPSKMLSKTSTGSNHRRSPKERYAVHSHSTPADRRPCSHNVPDPIALESESEWPKPVTKKQMGTITMERYKREVFGKNHSESIECTKGVKLTTHMEIVITTHDRLWTICTNVSKHTKEDKGSSSQNYLLNGVEDSKGNQTYIKISHSKGRKVHVNAQKKLRLGMHRAANTYDVVICNLPESYKYATMKISWCGRNPKSY